MSVSVTLAEEIVRAALAQHHLPTLGNVSGPWRDKEVSAMPITKMLGIKKRKVYIRFTVHGVDTRLEAICYVFQGSDTWDRGNVSILPHLGGRAPFVAVFLATLENNRLIISTGDTPS
jgi:hypothetical protein